MKTKLTGILIMLLSLTGCIKETLDECPEGKVKIGLYAEKFQTNSVSATSDIEENFGKRIGFLHCILYQENNYLLDTLIPDVSGVNGPSYDLVLPRLAFGNYRLVVIGNCTPDLMQGDLHTPGNMVLLYPGVDTNEDIFATTLSFTVDCDCLLQFETKLRRLQGVVHCLINHIPEEASEAEVVFHGVNSKIGKEGRYSESTDISRRIPIEPSNKDRSLNFVVGVFPTTENQPVSYQLKLYGPAQEEAIFDRTFPEKVTIIRNQLVELITNFSGWDVSFEIKVNSMWDPSIPGGDVEVE